MIRKQQRVPSSDVFFYELDSKKKGPTILITANIHGDECTGFGVVVRLLEELPNILQTGKVILYPSLNPKGLQQQLRVHPDSGKDLNRIFPGKSMGGSAERIVHTIWNSIQKHKPDIVLDLHTDSGASIPYVIIDRMIQRPKSSI